MEPKLTPRRVAEAIGVSESSLKRWADDGRIVVHRTVGGHRRMHHAEVIQFVRTAGLRVVRPDLLGLPTTAELDRAAGSAIDPGDRLYELLREGHAFGVHAFLLNLYLNGASIADLCDGPICEAMHRFGKLWHDEPERGITTEHLAVTTLVQGISSLRAAVTPDCHGVESRAGRSLVLGCAPSGDPFLLPSMLAAWVLAEAGCCDLNLGPETPIDALLDAVEHHKPVVTWIACSSVAARPTDDDLKRVLQALHPHGGTLVIGGRGFADSPPPPLPCMCYCRSMTDLHVYTSELLKDCA